MVFRILIALLMLAPLLAWGGGGRQLCLSCHPAHYVERGGCAACHQGNPASVRKNIAHAGLRSGKYASFTLGDSGKIGEWQLLLDRLACRRCHMSGGRGNRLAVSLDDSAVRRTAADLALSIRKPVANMPDFALDEERITALVNVILAGAQGRETSAAAPVKIHFAASGTGRADIFSTKCGSCHRMLSGPRGGLGAGNSAPNLSGLLTEYYPKTFRDNGVWSAEKLGGWVKNPRDTRRWARMQPVPLSESEMAELVLIMTVAP